jgi:hypothetical protein
MATHTPPTPARRAPTQATEGEGWLAYAGVLVLIGGVLNVIWGIAAIDKASFFVADSRYVFSDLSTWGWVALLIGVGLIAAGIGIFNGNRVAIWAGIAFVSVNAIQQLLSIDAYPFWALALFALDLLALYGLIAYGVKRY